MENRRGSAKKICTLCLKEKKLTEYHIRDKSPKFRATNPRRYTSRCKECRRQPAAPHGGFDPDRSPRVRYGSQTPAGKRALAAAYKRRTRRASRIKALEYLAAKGCETCGERDPRILEFDHLKPEDKIDTIANLLGNGYSWGSEKLRAEIRKCRVLCANCHRRHTVEQMEYYSHPDVADALRGVYEMYDIGE